MTDLVSWQVTFRRYKTTPGYQSTSVIIVSKDGSLQSLIDTLRGVYPEAQIETAENLGITWIAKDVPCP